MDWSGDIKYSGVDLNIWNIYSQVSSSSIDTCTTVIGQYNQVPLVDLYNCED